MKNFKGILWAVIFGVVSMAAPSVWPQTGAHTMVTPGELKWADVPSLPPGEREEGQLMSRFISFLVTLILFVYVWLLKVFWKSYFCLIINEYFK